MKKKIAIVTGGNQSESVISLKSAEQLSHMIDQNVYDIYIISIIGNHWLGKSDGIQDIPVNREDFSLTINGKRLQFDCVFISIHGNPGEDGVLQSYFELLNLPYTSCGVCSSAVTFNKYVSKIYLRHFGVETSKTLIFRKKDTINFPLVITELGLPCFVKPNEAGSSFGVSKVNQISEMEKAISEAFKEDNEILIEEYIKGREVTCGVYKFENQEIIFPVTEIVSKKDFFDYEAKYTSGMSEEITPAQIGAEMTSQIQILSSKIYDWFDCSGIVRIDFIIKNDIPYFLEVNSVPGMSQNSIIPQQIRAMGKDPKEVFAMVIENAISKKKKA